MFYINPPRGEVALHILENCVFTRMEYLKLLDDNSTDSFTGNFEYLLENSMYDSIGHFTMRLISSALSQTWSCWERRETRLFEQRLNHLSVRQVHRLFRKIIKDLRKRDAGETFVSKALMEISTHFLEPCVFNHVTAIDHREDCREYKCRVPFAAVPDLIRERLIELSHGKAIVVCCEWKSVLISLFRSHLTEAKLHSAPTAQFLVSSDPRLMFISQRMSSQVLNKRPENGGITIANVDEKSKNFPLCMQNLHSILREKHRLSHHARFYYSLFLRECGMRMDDAIIYWKEEYSKPHTCQSGCTHNWRTDERKFLYSIRHLYGLEGGRKNYKTPSCKAICSDIPGLRYEGGCPFKHFDANTLGKLLRGCMNEADVREQFHDVAQQAPEVACSNFFQIVHKSEGGKPVIHSPVQYYMKVTEVN